MIEPTSREKLKSIIEEEGNFSQGVIRPVGRYYHEFIRGYGKEDRGLEEALELIEYLECDVWPIFVKNRIQVGLFFPYVRKEFQIINKLTEQIKKASQLLKEKIESGRTTLYPEEVARLVYDFQNPRIYMDYVAGRNHLTYEMLDGRRLSDILQEFRPAVEAFKRKVIISNSDDLTPTYYMGKIEEYSFLTLFIVDAYDNSLLEKLTEARSEVEREEILKEYSPLSALNKILFSVEEETIKYNRESLRERKERKNLCLPKGSLAQRIRIIDGGAKFLSYTQKIYGKKRENLWYV
jgi:hypothetical protein